MIIKSIFFHGYILICSSQFLLLYYSLSLKILTKLRQKTKEEKVEWNRSEGGCGGGGGAVITAGRLHGNGRQGWKWIANSASKWKCLWKSRKVKARAPWGCAVPQRPRIWEAGGGCPARHLPLLVFHQRSRYNQQSRFHSSRQPAFRARPVWHDLASQIRTRAPAWAPAEPRSDRESARPPEESRGWVPPPPPPPAATLPPAAPQLTCLARLAVALQLHASGAGARVVRLPRRQQAQVGAAAIVLLTPGVDWGQQGRWEKVPERALDPYTLWVPCGHPRCPAPSSRPPTARSPIFFRATRRTPPLRRLPPAPSAGPRTCQCGKGGALDQRGLSHLCDLLGPHGLHTDACGHTWTQVRASGCWWPRSSSSEALPQPTCNRRDKGSWHPPPPGAGKGWHPWNAKYY